ncbi:hypothetical protein SBA5_490004 [Candidatus Sulfotelmatomonas gaucii]|uniref:Uncharacterized protein n=1 Tax=Candidatus Sulfuritelmatomonas gaucii TaxID=2043161 RepID=A0A2N9LPM7_9BACT|nr:hypothetical protein SBA5_490004 [Candidatus Sulfotelmatomonas gaucii]
MRQNKAQNRVLEYKKLHLIALSRNYMVSFAPIRNLRWLQIAQNGTWRGHCVVKMQPLVVTF